MALLRRSLLTTLIIDYLFLQLALRFGLIGPSLLDLKSNLSISYEAMSTAFSTMCVGISLGSLGTGLLTRLLPCRELSALLLMSATGALVAWYTYALDYTSFLVCNFLVGVSSGAAISSCEAWILELWGSKCGPYMQALQFFRGLGYIVGPILVDPFLSNEGTGNETPRPNTTLFTPTKPPEPHFNGTTLAPPTLAPPTPPFNASLHTPFLINTVLIFLGSALLLVLLLSRLFHRSAIFDLSKGPSQQTIVSRLSATPSIDASISSQAKVPPSSARTTTIEAPPPPPPTTTTFPPAASPAFTITMLLLASVFYFFFYEEVIVTYLPSYCTQIRLHLTKSEASLLTSAFALSNLLGKAVGILLALKMTPIRMLSVNLTIMATSLTVLLFYGEADRLVLWSGMCTLGFGLSSIVASLYTLLETSVPMSPGMCGVLNMAGTLGSVVTPFLIGPRMERQPAALLWVSLLYTALCGLLVAAMEVLLRLRYLFEETLEETIQSGKERIKRASIANGKAKGSSSVLATRLQDN